MCETKNRGKERHQEFPIEVISLKPTIAYTRTLFIISCEKQITIRSSEFLFVSDVLVPVAVYMNLQYHPS